MSGGSSSSRPKDFTPAAYKGLQNRVAGTLLESFQGETGAGQWNPSTSSDFSGFAAQLTPQQRAGINQVQGLADPAHSDEQMRTLQGIAGGNQLDLANDPVFNANLDFLGRRVISAFDPQEEATKALYARAGQQLPSSSAFAKSQSKISESKQQALTDLAAQMGGQALQANRDRQLQAQTQLQGLQKSRLEGQLSALETQDLPRMIQDLGLERAREEFMKRQAAIREQMALAGQLSSPTIASRQQSTNFGLL